VTLVILSVTLVAQSDGSSPAVSSSPRIWRASAVT